MSYHLSYHSASHQLPAPSFRQLKVESVFPDTPSTQPERKETEKQLAKINFHLEDDRKKIGDNEQRRAELSRNPFCRHKDGVDKWRVLLRTFDDEIKDHGRSDSALYAFYRSLKAPALFHQHALSTLEALMQKHFDAFDLIPRGSILNETGLKHTADLDVDLILPRSMIAEVLKQSTGSPHMFARMATGERDDDSFHTYWARHPDRFPALVRLIATWMKEAHPAADGVIQFTTKPSDCTRSIPFTLQLDGVRVEVDLFPKLLDDEGNVCEVSAKDPQYNQRRWIRTPALRMRRIPLELNEMEKAAILLLKLWKVDQQLRGYSMALKSYHFNLALERVRDGVKSQLDIEASQAMTAAAASAVSSSNTASQDFTRDGVLAYLRAICTYLKVAFDPKQLIRMSPGQLCLYEFGGNATADDVVKLEHVPFAQDLAAYRDLQNVCMSARFDDCTKTAASAFGISLNNMLAGSKRRRP